MINTQHSLWIALLNQILQAQFSVVFVWFGFDVDLLEGYGIGLLEFYLLGDVLILAVILRLLGAVDSQPIPHGLGATGQHGHRTHHWIISAPADMRRIFVL